MSLFARLLARVLSWWQGIPQPPTDATTRPILQSWHEFDPASAQWCSLKPARVPTKPKGNQDAAKLTSLPLRLVTWNVDSDSRLAEQRLEAILSRIFSLSLTVDIVFLQELNHAAIAYMLEDSRIRRDWFLSDTDDAIPNGQRFTSITLLSKARFQHTKASSQSSTLGPVWRVKYPSRFARDALCCDIFVPSSAPNSTSRIRLINVHLDSLPLFPSLRAQQISIAAFFLRSAGRGIVAGDFNPVLPEDTPLVGDHELVDAWTELRPGELGYTWNIDGKTSFLPNRMDKVTAFGMRLLDIDIYHPGTVGDTVQGETGEAQERTADGPVAWSDHSGISCTFELPA